MDEQGTNATTLTGATETADAAGTADSRDEAAPDGAMAAAEAIEDLADTTDPADEGDEAEAPLGSSDAAAAACFGESPDTEATSASTDPVEPADLAAPAGPESQGASTEEQGPAVEASGEASAAPVDQPGEDVPAVPAQVSDLMEETSDLPEAAPSEEPAATLGESANLASEDPAEAFDQQGAAASAETAGAADHAGETAPESPATPSPEAPAPEAPVASAPTGGLRFRAALAAGKITAAALKLARRNGGQLPGAIAERIDPDFLAHIAKPGRVVMVTGTNGKTTTANLLDDLLQDNGFTPVTNRAGGNVIGGFESAFLKNAQLSGEQREQFACMELDELSSRLILPHVHPDLLLVTNLYRDSFMRNANPDYIFRVLSESIPADTELVLNADDLISCRVAPQCERRTYFSIGELPGDTRASQGIVSDLTACPVCGGRLTYDWCHVRHLGRAHCESCGFSNPEADFEVIAVDEEARSFTVRENHEEGRPEQVYRIESYSITNLYNLLSAIVVARRLGISAADIAASLERGVHITSLRYSVEEERGVRLVNVAAKGEISTATSTALQILAEEPGKKVVVLLLADNYHTTDPYLSEYTGWYYQTDFEHLADPSIAQVVVAGERREDLHLRLLLAGVAPGRIRLAADVDEAASLVDAEDIEGVYVAYDIFNGDMAVRLRSLVAQRIREGADAAVDDDARPRSAFRRRRTRPAGTAPGAPSVAVMTDVAPDQGAGAVVEVLYPEFANQAGDNGNALYLRACLPGATFVETRYGEEPAFATQEVDAIVLGSLTEAHQQLAARALRPYAQRLARLADAGVPMLFTHSAAEILGSSFETPEGTREDGLGILDLVSRQDMPKRYLCSLVGSFDPGAGDAALAVIGFKIQFTQSRGNNVAGDARAFCELERGWGLSEGSQQEGYRRGGLIATWTLGPLLVTNPDLARWFVDRVLVQATLRDDRLVAPGPAKLAFEDEAYEAYAVRLDELTKPLPAGKSVSP